MQQQQIAAWSRELASIEKVLAARGYASERDFLSLMDPKMPHGQEEA